MTPAHALAEKIRDGFARFQKSLSRKPSSYPTNRASEMGAECVRYLTLLRTRGELATPPSPRTLSLFNEGRVHEREIKRMLADMGIDVYGSEQGFPENSYLLSGHIDAMHGFWWHGDPDAGIGMATAGPDEWARVGIEIKTLNDAMWSRIREDHPEDLREHHAGFIRKWYTQAQLYMFLEDLGEWLFIIKNKTTGEWKIVVMELDLDFVQTCVDKAEVVNRHVAADTLPDHIKDPTVCRRCRFYRSACTPAEEWGPGIQIITDHGLADLAEEVRDQDHVRKVANANRNRLRDVVMAMCQGEERDLVLGNVLVRTRRKGNSLGMDLFSLKQQSEPEEEE